MGFISGLFMGPKNIIEDVSKASTQPPKRKSRGNGFQFNSKSKKRSITNSTSKLRELRYKALQLETREARRQLEQMDASLPQIPGEC